jgi:hypothetical protein
VVCTTRCEGKGGAREEGEKGARAVWVRRACVARALRPDDGMEKIAVRRERGSSERGATRVTSEADEERGAMDGQRVTSGADEERWAARDEWSEGQRARSEQMRRGETSGRAKDTSEGEEKKSDV